MRTPLPAVLTALTLLAAACTTQPPPETEPFDTTAYRGFLIPEPLLPFRAEGSALLTFRGERETGEMTLRGGEEGAYRLRLLARLTGTLVVELRFDADRLLLLDYINERYYRVPNTAANRRRLFGVDLSPDEFQMLLTGRVPGARFLAGGGRMNGSGRASFREGDTVYRFWLDDHGLPTRWRKESHGSTQFRVVYREYATRPASRGPPLRLPRKIRLYLRERTPVLVLGITRFRRGDGSSVPIPLFALPMAAAHFTRGDPAALPFTAR